MKPVILFFPQNLLSHYLRCLSVAKKIENYHEILFIGSAAYNRFIVKEGFGVVEEINSGIEEVLDKAKYFDFSWINKANIEALFLHQVNIIEKVKPDIVVGDANLSLKMAAEKTGICYVALQNNYLNKNYYDIRPVPHHHKANLFKDKMSERSWESLIASVEKIVLRSVHKPFRNIRNKYKLSTQRNLLDEFEGNFNLLLDNSVLFPIGVMGNESFFIGPQMYESTENEDELVSWLNMRSNRKTMYVSMGSSADIKNSLYFLNHVLFSDFNIVLSGIDCGVSDNIFSKPFINFNQIAEFTDVYVCHGGNGSLYQALFNALPIIMIPTIFEQEWNVHRIVKLKLGDVHYPEQGIEDLFEKLKFQLSRKGCTELREMQIELLRTDNYYSVNDAFKQIIKQESLSTYQPKTCKSQ